ncbi:MAG: enoyl-CoA hydratase/isomerase family protein [Bdellovibrionales bacterium]|nr:enoyl-CoA hydratase/isomerase family protein [Bdellovibrionales bacterium]
MALDIQHGDIVQIQLNHPAGGNAFGLNEARQLKNAMESWQIEELVGIIFSSALPGFFCSGGNLKDYAKLSQKSEGLEVNRQIQNILNEFYQIPVLKVACVNGLCIGGGMELLSAFDYVLSSPHSLFGFWQRRVGLTFGWGGWERWQQKLTRYSLHKAALSAQTVGALQARDYGWVDEIASPETLVAKALWLLESQKSFPKGPRQAYKNLLFQGNELLEFSNLWWEEEHLARLSTYGKKVPG